MKPDELHCAISCINTGNYGVRYSWMNCVKTGIVFPSGVHTQKLKFTKDT